MDRVAVSSKTSILAAGGSPIHSFCVLSQGLGGLLIYRIVSFHFLPADDFGFDEPGCYRFPNCLPAPIDLLLFDCVITEPSVARGVVQNLVEIQSVSGCRPRGQQTLF